MADHLITYVEFLGLPGSGKSYYSHKIAERLRAEGFDIIEPSWSLDHATGKCMRAIKKICMALLFSMEKPNQANQIKEIIGKCGYKGGERKRMMRNLLYKAYILNGGEKKTIFFDEGLSQMAVSLSLGGKISANMIYSEIEKVLSIRRKCVIIRIDCNIDDALHNMEMRDKHDSRVEKLSDLNAKKSFLERYKVECESIEKQSTLINYSKDAELTDIIEYIKNELIV